MHGVCQTAEKLSPKLSPATKIFLGNAGRAQGFYDFFWVLNIFIEITNFRTV